MTHRLACLALALAQLATACSDDSSGGGGSSSAGAAGTAGGHAGSAGAGAGGGSGEAGAAGQAGAAGAAGEAGATAGGAGQAGEAGAAGTGGAAGAGGGTGGAAGAAGAGGADACAALDPLTLSNAAAADAGGDGGVSPGEAASVTVTLTNTGGEDHFAYPGVRLTSDDARVTIDSPDFTLYGIFAGQSVEAQWSVTFGAAIPAGTQVPLRAQVTALGESCPDANDLEFTVPISP